MKLRKYHSSIPAIGTLFAVAAACAVSASAQLTYERQLAFRETVLPGEAEDTAFHASNASESQVSSITSGVLHMDTTQTGGNAYYVIDAPALDASIDIAAQARVRIINHSAANGSQQGAVTFGVANGNRAYVVTLVTNGVYVGGNGTEGGRFIEGNTGFYRSYRFHIRAGQDLAMFFINGVPSGTVQGVPSSANEVRFGDVIGNEANAYSQWDFIQIWGGTNYLGSGGGAQDFNGDGASDSAFYARNSGDWEIILGNRKSMFNWGWSETVPTPGDYDGDGFTEAAVYHQASGNWYILFSDGTARISNWGWFEAIPVPGDYDGDGRTDLAVYHVDAGNWYILFTNGEARVQNWGFNGTIPAPADYDGDGRTDLAVFDPANGNWYILRNSNSADIFNWGFPGTVPIPGNYLGDSGAEPTVYHPATGRWYILGGVNGAEVMEWGWSETMNSCADYDGDGIDDLAALHPAGKTLYILRSSDMSMQTVNTRLADAMPADANMARLQNRNRSR